MNFTITPDFSSKVFYKVAQLANQDLDLTEKQAQVDFCLGFVDFLEKEAKLSPAMALGLIQNICERGAEWAIENSSDKVAAEEDWSDSLKTANQTIQELKLLVSLTEIQQKEAGILGDAAGWVGNKIKSVYDKVVAPTVQQAGKDFGSGSTQGAFGEVGNALSNFGNTLKDYGGKAWGFIKDNIGSIAPVLATGLAGALATKAVGGKDMPLWGAGLGGLASAGAGHLFFNNTQAGEDAKKMLREQYNSWFQSK